MNQLIITIICVLVNIAASAQASKGVYRIPYANGTQVRIWQDHITHAGDEPEIDMAGVGNGPFRIVAAEDGEIKFIQDSFSATTNGNPCNNNYVWIAHPNGEWTKYSHFTQNSVTGNAGLSVGDQVCAGTFLGFEDDVGCANGEHLHFEVGIPFDLSDPITAGGFIKGNEFIPIICNIAGNVFVQGTTDTAGPCGSCLSTLNNTNGTFNNQQYDIDIASVQVSAGGHVVFNAGSTGAYRAGRRVVLTSGFHAKRGSSFYAMIKDCNSSPGNPNCGANSKVLAIDNQ